LDVGSQDHILKAARPNPARKQERVTQL